MVAPEYIACHSFISFNIGVEINAIKLCNRAPTEPAYRWRDGCTTTVECEMFAMMSRCRALNTHIYRQGGKRRDNEKYQISHLNTQLLCAGGNYMLFH